MFQDGSLIPFHNVLNIVNTNCKLIIPIISVFILYSIYWFASIRYVWLVFVKLPVRKPIGDYKQKFYFQTEYQAELINTKNKIKDIKS